MTNKYNIAGLIVEISTTFNRTAEQAKAYLYNGNEQPLFKISLTKEEIDTCLKENPHLNNDDVEYILLGMKFYQYILRHNGILLHSSAVVKDGKAYLFSAPSGTGKSTHTSLWLKNFDDAYILNDDKPAIINVDGKIYAAGTPFSGKFDISRNELIPLQGICFIERSLDNWIKRIDSKQAIFEILNQTERIPYEDDMDLIFNHVSNIVTNIPIYKMGCNISDDAAKTSYEMMKNK